MCHEPQEIRRDRVAFCCPTGVFLFLQSRRHITLDRLWLVARRIAVENCAVGTDKELGEVPLDRLSTEDPGLLRLQVFVERVRVLAVHLDLCEHRKADAVVPSTELLDLDLTTRLLLSELITGKTEHHESPVLEFVVERLQSCVLRREAALARDVDDEQGLTAVNVHLLRFAVDGHEVDVVEAHRSSPRTLRQDNLPFARGADQSRNRFRKPY